VDDSESNICFRFVRGLKIFYLSEGEELQMLANFHGRGVDKEK
jgi:hypothetical protein